MLDRTSQENVKFFSGYAPVYDREPHNLPENVVRVRDRVLAEYEGGLRTANGIGRHLDIGCGTGFIQRAVRRYYELSVGVDVTWEMLRRNEHSKAQADVYRLPFRNGEFNIVTAHAVLHHMRSPLRLLEEAYRVLAPGGVVWTGLDPNALWMNVGFTYRKDEPYWFGFTPEGLKALVELAGFVEARVTLDWFDGQAQEWECEDAIGDYLNRHQQYTAPLFKYLSLRGRKPL